MFPLPLKEYIEIGLAAAVVIFVGWFVHHERVIGQQQVVVAQQAADIKEAQHVAQVSSDAAAKVSDLQARLSGALAAPVKPAVTVRVCLHPDLPADAGSPSLGPIAGSDEASGPSSGVGENDLGLDIAPPTEAILKRDKAVIDYLQGYVRTCQSAGLCKK